MELRTGLSAVVLAVMIGRLVRDGMRRRHGVWTRQSWIAFAVLVTLVAAMLAVFFYMVLLLDTGVREGMTKTQRSLYSATMLSLFTLGVPGLSILLLWFAHGRPDRQLEPRKFLRSFISR